MRKQTFVFMFVLSMILTTQSYSQNIAINGTGNAPDTSAMLDVSSTTKGLLAPRMTTTQQNAIPLPANGLLIFNNTSNAFNVNTGTSTSPVWTPLQFSGSSGITSLNGLSVASQTFSTGNSGTDFNISSSGSTHTFNIPDASATARGAITTGIQTIAGNKTLSGNTQVGGTFGVTGATTLSSTLGVTGATTLSSTLGVTGNSTFTGTIIASTLNSGASTDSIVTVNASSGLLKKRSLSDVLINTWSLTGNSNTTPGTNYLGTFDNQDMRFKRFNTNAGIIGTTNTTFGLNAGNIAGMTSANNTAIGVNALNAITSGGSNTAVGYQALNANTTKNADVAVGYRAGYNDTTGGNSFFGYSAGTSNTGGTNITAIGYNALTANTTGTTNTAIGFGALATNTTSSYNTAVGSSAMAGNTGGANTAVGQYALGGNNSGGGNTAIGQGALSGNTTGSSNTALGQSSLNANTIGLGNVALGQGAMILNVSGNYNVGLGQNCLSANTSGNYNMAIGQYSLASHKTGDFNVAIGQAALHFDSSGGTQNVAIGHGALGEANANANTAIGELSLSKNGVGLNKTAVGAFSGESDSLGGNNTFIGTYADNGVGITTALTNATAIGYMAKVNTSNSLVLGGTGANVVNVGIGTTSPGQVLEVMNGNILVNNNNNTSGELRIAEPSSGGTNYTSFKTQTQAANVTYTLPAADGTSGNKLTTNGSGLLSWSPTGGVAALTTTSSAINTTETQILNYTIPANMLAVGTTFRIKASGTCTTTVANASNFRIRLGNLNTNSDAQIVTIASTAAASGSNIPFNIDELVTIRVIGAASTASAIGSGVLNNNGTTGVSAAAVVVAQTVAPVTSANFATTSTAYIQLTYQSAANTTTCTFYNATIELVKL